MLDNKFIRFVVFFSFNDIILFGDNMQDEASKYYIKMTETKVSKLVTILGIPTVISMLITNIYNLADTYFVGTLGKSEQGATGILFTLQCIIQAFAFMLGHGSGVNISRALAAKDSKKASEYATSAVFFGSIISILLLVFGLLLIKPFMYLLGSTDTILPYAMDYGMWVLISCPFMAISLIFNNIMRYEGKAFYAMFGLSSGALLNIFGDYIFINVMHLGVYGAGMSTAISQIISFIILVIFFFKMCQSKLRFRFISKDFFIYFKIVRVGFPSFIRQGLTSISHGILNNVAGAYGDEAIAAISVVNRLSQFALAFGLGIGQGFQPVAAFNYQAKRYDRVKKAMRFTLYLGLVLVGIIGFIYIIIPTNVASIFSHDQDVINIAKRGIIYSAIGIFFLPISVIANMLYQSIGKAEAASFLSLLRSGLTFIPAIYINAAIWGLEGILWAQPTADIISALVSLPFIIYFLQKKFDVEVAEN